MAKEKTNMVDKLRSQNKKIQSALKVSQAAEKKFREKWQAAIKNIALEKKAMTSKLEEIKEQAFAKAHEAIEAARVKKEALKEKFLEKALASFEKAHAKKMPKVKAVGQKGKKKSKSTAKKVTPKAVVGRAEKKTSANASKRGRPAKKKAVNPDTAV